MILVDPWLTSHRSMYTHANCMAKFQWLDEVNDLCSLINQKSIFYLKKSLLSTQINNNFFILCYLCESTTHTLPHTDRYPSAEKVTELASGTQSLLGEVVLLRELLQHHCPDGNMQISIWYFPPCSAPRPLKTCSVSTLDLSGKVEFYFSPTFWQNKVRFLNLNLNDHTHVPISDFCITSFWAFEPWTQTG